MDKRRRRRLAVELAEELGPDRSRPVHDFGDGWSVVRVRRLADQWREGFLMRNCLAAMGDPTRYVWSLRDVENLPHATFTLFRLGDIDPDWIADLPNEYARFASVQLLVTDRLVLVPDRSRHLKPAYMKRLAAFADVVPTRGIPPIKDWWTDLVMDAPPLTIPEGIALADWFEAVRIYWNGDGGFALGAGSYLRDERTRARIRARS